MKNIAIALVITALSCTQALAERAAVVEGETVTQSQWFAYMPELASQMNKDVPKTIDHMTTIKRYISKEDGLELQYKVDTAAYPDTTKDEWQTLVPQLRLGEVNKYCTDPAFQVWLELGTIMHHTYYFNDGTYMGKFIINPDIDCK